MDADGNSFRMNFAPLATPEPSTALANSSPPSQTTAGSTTSTKSRSAELTSTRTHVDAALDGWEDWALLYHENDYSDCWISLDAIQARINAAGLGIDTDPPPSDK